MRRMQGFHKVVAVAGLGAVGLVGCDYSCYSDLSCSYLDLGTGAGGGTSEPVDPCPDPALGSVAEDCGLWVSASLGDDANPGTQGAPLKTLGAAVALAKTGPRRVYACSEAYDESVTLPAGTSLFGGFQCASGWKYVGGDDKARIAPSARGVALRLTEGNGESLIRDVAITAQDATLPGESSIAVFALPGAAADIERATITAGDGMRGADGQDDKYNGEPAKTGVHGVDGGDACAAFGPGGAAVLQQCDDGGSSMGGQGGNGGEQVANDGAAGFVAPNPNPQGLGLGGDGETVLPCTGGQVGGQGGNGKQGLAAMGLGRLTLDGVLGADGEDGGHGLPGQGGGGGGASRGKATCGGTLHGGPGGGSGGAGGCGGRGGKGGQAGGSSIGLATLSDAIHLNLVFLYTGKGGDGGNGGIAQPGGQGGLPGIGGAGLPGADAINAGCAGGSGGYGGSGGHGAGGRGGHSAWIAALPTIHPDQKGLNGSEGAAGHGGHGGEPSAFDAHGLDGIRDDSIHLDP